MKTKRYTGKKFPTLPVLSFAMPVIPLLIFLYHTVFAMQAKALGDSWTMFSIAVSLISILSAALPICGGAGMVCSLLWKRKTGKTKGCIAAIILNGLMLVLALPFLYTQLAA